MTYISLYRKWRSQNFEEIIGQEAVVQTLQNAIKLNRLAHAYLFSGPRGTGKTSTARILAKALNCKNGPTPHPCGKCDLCEKIRDGHSVDVIEIDAASNRGIDQIRDLRDRVRFAPIEGQYKVYIIDEVHMLTAEAFNALLKTLEEPPEHVVFVLATTDPQKVPVTIWSRCQRLDFKKIPLAKIIRHLEQIAKDEKIEINEKALNMIGRSSSGSLRDAISLLDQLVSFSGNTIKTEDVLTVLGGAEEAVLFNFGEALAGGNTRMVLELVEKNIADGKSVLQVTKDLIFHFRYLLFAKLEVNELIDLGEEQIKEMQVQSQLYSEEQLKQIIKALSRAQVDMRWQPQARLVLEAALLEVMLNESQGPISKQEIKIEAPKVKIEKPKEKKAEAEAKAEAKAEAEVEVKVQAGEEIETIKNHWTEILEKVKTKTLFGYVSLHEGRPLGLDDKNKLLIEYKKGFSFHKKRLEDQQNKEAVEAAIYEITGIKIVVAGVVSDRVDDGESPVEQKQAKPTEEFSLDKVKEMFGGKVLS